MGLPGIGAIRQDAKGISGRIEQGVSRFAHMAWSGTREEVIDEQVSGMFISLIPFVTPGQAEVLQEIIHRYSAIRRPDAIQPAFDAVLGIVDEVFPVEEQDVRQAKDILFAMGRLSSRDALHLAIMRRHSVREIMSFDSGFDGLPGISRIA